MSDRLKRFLRLNLHIFRSHSDIREAFEPSRIYSAAALQPQTYSQSHKDLEVELREEEVGPQQMARPHRAPMPPMPALWIQTGITWGHRSNWDKLKPQSNCGNFPNKLKTNHPTLYLWKPCRVPEVMMLFSKERLFFQKKKKAWKIDFSFCCLLVCLFAVLHMKFTDKQRRFVASILKASSLLLFVYIVKRGVVSSEV